MGIITAAGSVGRIIFLLFVDNVSRNGVMALAAVSSILCGISIVVFKWIVAHPMSARLAAVNTNGFQKQAADGELPLPISKVPQSALESLPTATASPKPRFQLSLPSTAAQGADAIPAQQPAEAKADDAADGKACV